MWNLWQIREINFNFACSDNAYANLIVQGKRVWHFCDIKDAIFIILFDLYLKMRILLCLFNFLRAETQAENEKKAKALLEGFSCVSFGVTISVKMDQLYILGKKNLNP